MTEKTTTPTKMKRDSDISTAYIDKYRVKNKGSQESKKRKKNSTKYVKIS